MWDRSSRFKAKNNKTLDSESTKIGLKPEENNNKFLTFGDDAKTVKIVDNWRKRQPTPPAIEGPEASVKRSVRHQKLHQRVLGGRQSPTDLIVGIDSPGPGYYNVESESITSCPTQFRSIKVEIRESQSKPIPGPGPGQYQVEQSLIKSSFNQHAKEKKTIPKPVEGSIIEELQAIAASRERSTVKERQDLRLNLRTILKGIESPT